jgi:hypothetical protein
MNKLKKTNIIKNNKGNWEYNFFQKIYNPNEEAKIKLSIKPDNIFDVKNINKYIEKQISKEEIILEKKNKNIILKNNEKIILKNYIKKKDEAINNDIKNIKLFGLSAKPITNEGKIRLILETLTYQLNNLSNDNKDLIGNIYFKLIDNNYIIYESIITEYKNELNKMNEIISKLDLIKLQMTKYYYNLPPLNTKGFNKFDEWQINVINNIDNNISTIINAPTSAGKSVLSGYVATKGFSLYIVPTDALAWQMSSYIGSILNTNIPIITETFQSHPKRDEMIELLNNSQAIVGTPDCILDYLPFIKNKFKWIIFDEIHMICKKEGYGMQKIAKILNNIPILALSASINDTDKLVEWFKNISPDLQIKQIICNKRFFNLQKYYYNSDLNNLIPIHPLSLIEKEYINDSSILNISLQPTPPDVWDLATKLTEKYELDELNPYIFFNKTNRIELNNVNEYFNKLLEYIIIKYKSEPEYIIELLNNYKNINLFNSNNSNNLINLVFKLKETKKIPVIIFQENTLSCLKIAKQFSIDIDNLENNKYPKLIQDRLKFEKKVNKINKKSESDEIDIKDNKLFKNMLNNENEYININSYQEPHEDFIFNDIQYFSEVQVNEWVELLKKYFPNNGDFYHYIIKLLWRGVGIYTSGLPDPYLRLVQTLAYNKQLAIVFSDKSLVFGISMPFRSVVILNNELDTPNYDLDPMLYQQMIGRAGRRGLDKEGNIIFVNYSWDKIKKLCISSPPDIMNFIDTNLYSLIHAKKLAIKYNNYQNWDNLLLNVNDNYNNKWIFTLTDTINNLHMNWKLRNNNLCIITSYLIPYLRRGFDYKDSTQIQNQIQIAHFLCRFYNKSTNNNNNILIEPDILIYNPFNQILKELNDIDIIIPKNIDNKLFLSIQNNCLLNNISDIEKNELRNELIEFSNIIKIIQHYCFHIKIIGVAKLLAKLLTRIWWIYHTSSIL